MPLIKKIRQQIDSLIAESRRNALGERKQELERLVKEQEHEAKRDQKSKQKQKGQEQKPGKPAAAGSAVVPVMGGNSVTVDAEDLQRVTFAGPWHQHIDEQGKSYPVRFTRHSSGRTIVEPLANYIADESPTVRLVPTDGDEKNYRRVNLKRVAQLSEPETAPTQAEYKARIERLKAKRNAP